MDDHRIMLDGRSVGVIRKVTQRMRFLEDVENSSLKKSSARQR